MLISSRRQIETQKISNGYVENFTTEDYANFIKKLNNNRIVLCRDHGGPYQGSNEDKYTKNYAMKLAKISYKADIDNNFKILHIDPSINSKKNYVKRNVIIQDILELIEYCYSYSKKKNKKIFFEIGTEEPSCFTGTTLELNCLIEDIIFNLNKNKLPKPLFCVLQTGVRVKELSNVGILNNLKYLKSNFIKIREISKICKKYKMFLKQHNTDYLNKIILQRLPNLNIDAANVAPECGYVESLALFEILKKYNKNKLLDRFLEISYKSNKWKKWLKKNSRLSDLQKSLLAGHYVFANNEFKELKKEIQMSLSSTLNLDQLLIFKIKNRILDYMKCFNYN